MLTLIQTAKPNGVDPQAWLADVLARIADHKITDLAALGALELAPHDAYRPHRLKWWRRLPHNQPCCRDPRRERAAPVGLG